MPRFQGDLYIHQSAGKAILLFHGGHMVSESLIDRIRKLRPNTIGMGEGYDDALDDVITLIRTTKPVPKAVGYNLLPAEQPVQQPPWKDMASGYYYLDAGSLTGPCQVEPIKRI